MDRACEVWNITKQTKWQGCRDMLDLAYFEKSVRLITKDYNEELLENGRNGLDGLRPN